MRQQHTRSRSLRGIAGLLVATQVAAGLPASAFASEPAAKAAPPPVKVNRTVPKVKAPPLLPAFSGSPTDDELFRARVFQEPLVPMGHTTPEENGALAQALMTYLQTGRPEGTGPLERFLDGHPGSAWSAGLLTNLGTVYRRTGYFTKAYAAWEKGWSLSRAETEPHARAIADKALAELAELSARLGRMEALEKLLAEAKDRTMRGSVTEKITGAQEGLWQMQHKPEEAFRCGPMALDRILAATRAGYGRDVRLVNARSTTRGTSLAQMKNLAGQVGLSMQTAFRTPGARVLVPAMVHWKAGHFAALVKEQDGRYLMQDPTFGDEMWVSPKALDEEASGYFLVPQVALPSGWRSVGRSEAEGVWGKGVASGTAPGVFGAMAMVIAGSAGAGSKCPGMAGYTFNALVAGLHIVDTPVGYSPALGPSASFTVRYSQRDDSQPQLFSYSNLGPKWTFDWISFVEDDPANPAASAYVYQRGGGFEQNSGYNAATSSYQRSYFTETILVRTSTSPVRYERRSADGSMEVFAQPDGAATYPRRVFMTEAVDAQGNRLQFTYDSSMRLVAVTDALGQVTTLAYELGADPLKITRVTDPFGRFARLDYDDEGRLIKTTDVIGLASEFSYTGAGDFIGALTTPYGTTQFAIGQNGLDRWAEATDPLGGRERTEYHNFAASLIPPPPASDYPPGYSGLDYADAATVYWSKRAMAVAPGDINAARIIHWMRNTNFNQATETVSYEKQPLEGRVWFSYPGQINVGQHRYIGTLKQPTEAARVLDDGQAQVYRYEYNTRGLKVREIEPVGRETVYVYGTNNVLDPDPATGSGLDLLQVKVKNGASPTGWDVASSTTYDQQHQPLTTTDAAGQATTYTYTSDGRLQTATTPPRAGITEERTTTYTYDSVTGNLSSVTGPGGVTSGSTYDAQGRLRTSTDNDGYTLTYDYDAFDRPTRTTYPDGTYEETQYEKLDPVRHRDRLGRWTHTFYDALRRVVSTRDPAGRMVGQSWCTCGSLERLVDAKGNPTTWEHDLQGRVTREVRANGSAKEFTYETTSGRLKKVKDAKGQETQYSYGLDDKLLQTAYVNAEHPTPNVTQSYTDPATGAPDAHGRLRQTVDGTGTTTYAYHPLGQLGAGQLASVDGPRANDTITYGYDELGRVVSRALNGVTSTWAYDALGRLTTQGDPIGNFTYSYVGSTGRVSTVTYPNGQTSSYAYGPVAQDLRLQEIHHRRPTGATLNKFDYTYDALGNILTWAQQTDGNPAQTYTFEYDRADQLTAATLAAPTPKRYRYAYDPAGNRTVEQIDDVATAATYDTMNRLTGQTAGGALAFRGTLSEPATVTVGGAAAGVSGGTQFSGSATVPSGTSQVVVAATDANGNLRTNTYEVTQTGTSKSFTYDANGNLTVDGTKTYEWDAASRLITVKQGPSTLASFTYGADGRRASKTAAGVTTTFVYSGTDLVEERPTQGATKRSLYGPGVDQRLATIVNGIPSFVVADHLGSVVRMLDAAGTPTLTRQYDPWGVQLEGSAASGPAFTGREWDEEPALYYYRARYYSAQLGIFIAEDEASTAGSGSLYAYVKGNPVNAIDPSGLVDLNLYSSRHSTKDDAWAEANMVKSPRGIFTIAGHGYTTGPSRGNPLLSVGKRDHVPLTVTSLADMIRANPRFKRCKEVWLLVCDAGSSHYPEELSQALGDIPVWAPTKGVKFKVYDPYFEFPTGSEFKQFGGKAK